MIGGFFLLFGMLLAIYVSEVPCQSDEDYTCRPEQRGQPVDGPCGEQCFCLDNKLEYCCRKRKNFPSMTRQERLLYVNTVIKASTDPQYSTEYNELIAKHRELFLRGIHTKVQFLPWHRWYLLKYENFLRRIDCRVTLPYWDWSLFPGAAWRQGVDDIWSSKPWGLGGSGNRIRRGRRTIPGCVENGRFGETKWNLTHSARAGCLRRSFNARPPDIIAVYLTKGYSSGQFDAFELELRANLHDTVHCRIGGTMCALNSANAPEFFIHHAFIDKIWADWQAKSTAHFKAFFHELDEGIKLTGAEYFRPINYTDTRKLPDPDLAGNHICVVYSDPVYSVYDEIMRRLDALSREEIMNIRRRPFRPASSRQLKRLGVTGKERQEAKKLLEAVEPKNPIHGNRDLESIRDRRLGFALDSIPFDNITSVKDSPPKSLNRIHARLLSKATNKNNN